MTAEDFIRALIHTAQPFEKEGHVVGITLDALRDALAGHMTHARAADAGCVMRIRVRGSQS